MNYVLDIGGKSNNFLYLDEFKEKEEKSLKDVIDELDLLNPGTRLFIGGAEPSLNKDFLNIIKECEKRKFKEITVITNARLFSNEKNCNFFKGKDIGFMIDVFGDKKIHDKLTKTESYDQTIKGIENLSMSNEVSVVFPLIDENKEEILKIVEEVSKYDIKRIYLKNIPGKTKLDNLKSTILDIYSTLPYLTRLLNFENIIEEIKDPDVYVNINYDNSDNEFNKNSEDINFKLIECQKRINEKSLVYVSLEEIMRLVEAVKEDFWKGAERLGYPIPIMLLILGELRKNDLVKINGFEVVSVLEHKKAKEAEIFDEQRLKSDPEFSQLTVSGEILKKRIKYITESCFYGSKIAVMGDDDFVSLSLASTEYFSKITVFEIDKNIVNKLRKIAKEREYDIDVVHHDLRKEFPKKYLDYFDVFYTDSPYSPQGFDLFISRGVSLLKRIPKRHGFSSFSPEMALLESIEIPVQKSISEMNLFIAEKKYPAFNNIPDSFEKAKSFDELYEKVFIKNKDMNKLQSWYNAALCRTEFLFHLMTTNKTRPLIKRDYDDEIYFIDGALKFYTDKEHIKNMKKNNDFYNY